MTDQEIRETIHEMLVNWNACMKLAIDAGKSKEEAREIVGKYFNTLVNRSWMMANLSLICQVFELSRQLRVKAWQAGLIQLTLAQIKEL